MEKNKEKNKENIINDVIVFPYTIDESKNIKDIGLFVSENDYLTVITGKYKDIDVTILETAKRIFDDECNCNISDDQYWKYIGDVTDGKVNYSGFIVNVSDFFKDNAGISSENIKWKPVSYLMKTDDVFISAIIMKIFIIYYM